MRIAEEFFVKIRLQPKDFVAPFGLGVLSGLEVLSDDAPQLGLGVCGRGGLEAFGVLNGGYGVVRAVLGEACGQQENEGGDCHRREWGNAAAGYRGVCIQRWV